MPEITRYDSVRKERRSRRLREFARLSREGEQAINAERDADDVLEVEAWGLLADKRLEEIEVLVREEPA